MARLVPIVYALLVAYLLFDCFKHRREAFWYLVLLLPVVGPGLYIVRFKF